jgi:hypothetical protein
MDTNLVTLINEYGFPLVACVGLCYFVYYVWTWVTKEINPVLSKCKKDTLRLIDRVRMLDNDLIRLDEKVQTVLELRGEKIARETEKAKAEINKNGNGH